MNPIFQVPPGRSVGERPVVGEVWRDCGLQQCLCLLRLVSSRSRCMTVLVISICCCCCCCSSVIFAFSHFLKRKEKFFSRFFFFFFAKIRATYPRSIVFSSLHLVLLHHFFPFLLFLPFCFLSYSLQLNQLCLTLALRCL